MITGTRITTAIVTLFFLCTYAHALNLGPTGIEVDPRAKIKGGIQVKSAAKGSPAHGKIKKGDIITGVNGKKFSGKKLNSHTKRLLAEAIGAAETRKGRGRITLNLKGNKQVVLTIPVLGSYSATAPYNCRKTDKMISQMAESLLASKKVATGATKAGLLGLLATGEKKYIDAVGRIIRTEKSFAWVKTSDGKPKEGKIYSIWRWSYSAILLSEYYLLTKDKSLLPAIRSLALTLAVSQDAGGLWGHTPLNKKTGRLHGYAQMNQPSLAAFMGMLLAQKCGVKDPVLDKAVATSDAYFRNYIGKGTFGYGVGSGSTRGFNNNGMSGSAAICMALRNNNEGVKFFSQMAATSYDTLEQGHANAFFNPLWTALGAHLSGPEVTQKFFQRSLWFHNLKRRWDGGYDTSDQHVGHWTGVGLLNYCLPRNALVITGRDADQSNWLKGKAADDAILMNKRVWKSGSAMSNQDLINLYTKGRFPQMQRRAGWSLLKERTQEQLAALQPIWANYLKSGTDVQKRLALSQYGMHTPLKDKAHLLKTIGAILRDNRESATVRLAAANSLGSYKEMAQPYYMDLVRLLTEERTDDPFGDTDVSIGRALNSICRTPFASGLVTDKNRFFKAALKLMNHKRDKVMVEGVKMVADIPLEDFHRVGDKVLHIARNQDTTLHHYHPLHAVKASINLLARLNIKEGVDCLENGFRGGRFNNEARMIIDLLPEYGGNAKLAAAALEAKTPQLTKGGLSKYWQKVTKAVKDDRNPRKLITFEQAMRSGR